MRKCSIVYATAFPIITIRLLFNILVHLIFEFMVLYINWDENKRDQSSFTLFLSEDRDIRRAKLVSFTLNMKFIGAIFLAALLTLSASEEILEDFFLTECDSGKF